MKISKTVPFGMMAATLVPLLMEKSKLAQKWHVPDKAKLFARKRLMKHKKKYNYSNCKVWFDGCNTCKVMNGGLDLACTRKMCRFASPPE